MNFERRKAVYRKQCFDLSTVFVFLFFFLSKNRGFFFFNILLYYNLKQSLDWTAFQSVYVSLCVSNSKDSFSFLLSWVYFIHLFFLPHI